MDKKSVNELVMTEIFRKERWCGVGSPPRNLKDPPVSTVLERVRTT